MKIIAILLLSLLVSHSLGLASLSFSGNVSVTNKADFNFRALALWFNPVLIPPVGYYASAEVSATIGPGSGQVKGDFIFGAIKFVTTQVPLSFMSYLSADASVQISVNNESIVKSIDVKVAAAFILVGYFSVVERNPSGTAVRTLLLKDCLWVPTNGNNTDGLHYVTLTCVSLGLGLTEHVKISFIISEVLGQVKIGAITTAVTPKTLESVLELNWNYQNSQNHLEFVAGVLSGAAAGKHSGMVTLSSGTGKSETYIHFSEEVDVAGTIRSAQVTKRAEAILDFNDVSLIANATTAIKGGVAYTTVIVAFPPGASNIIYDPAMGVGTPLGSAQSIIFSVLILSVFVLLF